MLVYQSIEAAANQGSWFYIDIVFHSYDDDRVAWQWKSKYVGLLRKRLLIPVPILGRHMDCRFEKKNELAAAAGEQGLEESGGPKLG